jgi:hypothetical protein
MPEIGPSSSVIGAQTLARLYTLTCIGVRLHLDSSLVPMVPDQGGGAFFSRGSPPLTFESRVQSQSQDRVPRLKLWRRSV